MFSFTLASIRKVIPSTGLFTAALHMYGKQCHPRCLHFERQAKYLANCQSYFSGFTYFLIGNTDMKSENHVNGHMENLHGHGPDFFFFIDLIF